MQIPREKLKGASAGHVQKQSRHQKNDFWSAFLIDMIANQDGLTEAISSIESKLIKQALDMTCGNVLQAAILLKIPRGTLRYKMEKYNLP